MRQLQGPRARIWGWVVLAAALGFAAGNHFKTSDALEGQARYFQQDEHKKIVAHVRLQKQLDNQ